MITASLEVLIGAGLVLLLALMVAARPDVPRGEDA